MRRVTVRQARPADDVDLLSVAEAAIRDGASETYSPAEVAAWAPDLGDVGEYESALDSDEYLVLVAELDDSVVGYGVLQVEHGSLLALYVDPTAGDGGIGSTLLGNVETSARFNGAATLDLLAARNSVGFYERHGYDRTGAVERDIDGESLTFVEMSKPLDGPSSL
ncbi:MAG: N-acetyltransferase family protein [Haloarculaceae archaeon]